MGYNKTGYETANLQNIFFFTTIYKKKKSLREKDSEKLREKEGDTENLRQ